MHPLEYKRCTKIRYVMAPGDKYRANAKMLKSEGFLGVKNFAPVSFGERK